MPRSLKGQRCQGSLQKVNCMNFQNVCVHSWRLMISSQNLAFLSSVIYLKKPNKQTNRDSAICKQLLTKTVKRKTATPQTIIYHTKINHSTPMISDGGLSVILHTFSLNYERNQPIGEKLLPVAEQLHWLTCKFVHNGDQLLHWNSKYCSHSHTPNTLTKLCLHSNKNVTLWIKSSDLPALK